MPITVQLGSRSYEVHVGAGLLARTGDLLRATPALARSTRSSIIADSNVPAALVKHARQSLEAASLATTIITIPGGEPCKTLANAEHLLQQLAASRHERTDPIIAIGGGALCDLAGFVAATYRRGVPIVHCPTTLLAMVDASVGGKTGVNLTVNGQLKKNMVGAFWQPAAVVADVETLRSLPLRELRSGLAECLKHALISGHTGDESLFDHTLIALKGVYSHHAPTLTDLVERNVRVKAAIIAGDEREEASDKDGGRALLNLGHTFGHVIESLTDLLHGECVALGLVAAAAASVHLNLMPADFLEHVRKAVRCTFHTSPPGRPPAVGLENVPNAADPTRLPPGLELPPLDRLIELMHEDKKTLGGDLRIVVPLPGARATVVRRPDRAALEAAWRAIGAR